MNKVFICAAFVILCLPCLSFSQSYSIAGTVEREALLVYGIAGKFSFRPDTGIVKDVYRTESGTVVTSFYVGSPEDTFKLGTFPYDDRIGMDAYLQRVVEKPYWYFFNEYFIVDGVSHLGEEQFYRYIQYNPAPKNTDAPSFDMGVLRDENRHYVWTDEKRVGKFWKLKGEWEHFIVPYKFRFFQLVSPEALIFDHYDIYVLKRVISLEEIDKPFAENDKSKIIMDHVPVFIGN
ncbi:hypothetical protein [Parapedobacter sp.]